ncbi:MAG: hypothetical protein NTV54_00510 [Ignavibacteriales bacterium]|nr:hypothetical protein [Ignavibacteriales bacterium]
MSEFRKTQLLLDHTYDGVKKQHYLNGSLTVLHCHHYTTLYTQLALDANETALLAKTAEETFYGELTAYFEQHDITTLKTKIELACDYYAAVGLGAMEVVSLGDDSGVVTLKSSHVDAGWLKKWGKHTVAVNYIGAGFIAAMFAVITGKPMGSFNAIETSSIVTGSPYSQFSVVRH